MTAHYGEFAYVASLQYYPDAENFCTGSLITRKHVITAAHCIVDERPEDVRIAFEAVSLEAVVPTFIVASWLTYDDWADRLGIQKDPGAHDIAIVTVCVT